MTKEEEIKLFKDFCNKLPSNSYLGEILEGVPEEVEKMIMNDWCFSISGQIDDIYKEREKLQEEIKTLQKRIEELKKGVRNMEYKLQTTKNTKKEIAGRLKEISWMLETDI